RVQSRLIEQAFASLFPCDSEGQLGADGAERSSAISPSGHASDSAELCSAPARLTYSFLGTRVSPSRRTQIHTIAASDPFRHRFAAPLPLAGEGQGVRGPTEPDRYPIRISSQPELIRYSVSRTTISS